MKFMSLTAVLIGMLAIGVTDVSSQGIIVDAALRRILENIRQMMRTGNPETGMPVLAPYFNEDLFFNASFGGLLDFGIRMTPAHIEGLDAFQGRLSVDLSTFRFPFEFRYNDELTMHGFYDMNGRAYGLIPLFGVGNFFIRPRGVVISGHALLVEDSNGMIDLRDFSISMYIDSLETNIQGMLLGGDLSDLLNEVIMDVVPSILRRFPEGMSDLLTAGIFPMAQRFLATRRFADLVSLLFPRGA